MLIAIHVHVFCLPPSALPGYVSQASRIAECRPPTAHLRYRDHWVCTRSTAYLAQPLAAFLSSLSIQCWMESGVWR
ncbi:hypothetical protein F5B20DRAFT_4977 [Whalleya microplaca]|nr:hypothetical protein F5B20DRAFT_4977 [Whalleya microplaca]